MPFEVNGKIFALLISVGFRPGTDEEENEQHPVHHSPSNIYFGAKWMKITIQCIGMSPVLPSLPLHPSLPSCKLAFQTWP